MRLSSLPSFAIGLLLCGASLSACSGETASYAPYAGEAYPNRRQKFEKAGRLLGYVANRRSDSVSVLDLDAMTELGRVPIGRDPVDIDGPRRFTIDEEAGLGYVALSYYLSVVSAHAETGAQVTQRLGYVLALDLNDLAQVGERRLEPNAHDIAFNPLTRQLLVSHFDTYRSSVEADPQARKASLDFITPASGIRDGSATLQSLTLCRAPSAVVLNSDGTRAFVACTGDDSIAVVDTATRTALTEFRAGPDNTNQPTALTADPEARRLVVSNQVPRAIVTFSMLEEPAMLTSLYFVGLPGSPTWVSDTALIVPTQDGQHVNGTTLVEIDGTTASIVREAIYELDRCENPSEVTRSRDGRVFVVCQGSKFNSGAVVSIDPTTLEILGRVEVGVYPEHLAIRE